MLSSVRRRQRLLYIDAQAENFREVWQLEHIVKDFQLLKVVGRTDNNSIHMIVSSLFTPAITYCM